MPEEPKRPVDLLTSAGIVVHRDTDARPVELPYARNVWAYVTDDGRFGLWIYEFEGQDELDAGMSVVEAETIPKKQARDFAQNGEFLLVVVPRHADRERLEDEDTIDRVLQAFSGDVER